MAVAIETMEEFNWRNGNNFVYIYAGNNLQLDQQVDLCFCVGDYDIAMTRVEFSGSAELITWNWYMNTILDKNTGTPVIQIPMNETVSSSSGTTLLINPNISDIGAKMIDADIDAIGVPASGVLNRLNDIILSSNLAIKKNTNHTIHIWNRNAADVNLEIKLTFFKMANSHG